MAAPTILVTGSNDGIGRATALELARRGAQVIVHGRNRERAEGAAEEIRHASQNPQVAWIAADLASLRQVRGMAAEILERFPRLDVLVNNAGVFKAGRELTVDGFETTLAVNHLAPFLLTGLVLERIKESAPARIVNVSSTLHQMIRTVHFDNLQGEKKYVGTTAYALSKLGNILFTYELADRLRGSGVTANTLHPGGINTKLLRAGFSSSGGTVEEGAETPVFLAVSRAVDGVTGKYFVRKQPAQSSPLSYDPELRRKFWDVSAELVGLDDE